MKRFFPLSWSLPGLKFLTIAVLAISITDSFAAKSPSKKEKVPVDLFDKIQVIKIRMEMPKSSLDQLQTSFTNLAVYVPAKIQEAGKTYDQVGVHLRGVSTFQTVDKKPNFTLKFNEFVKGGEFHGLRKILLSNCSVDRTYLQEFLAAELFRAAGVACPRVSFARVELNGRDLGLYVLLEAVTHDFLQENFGSIEGNVYEGDDADIDAHLEQDYGKRTKHQTDLRPLAFAAKEPDPVKRLQELEKVLKLDVFISMMAMETLMDSWDSYSQRITNYRVFCDHVSGRAHFIPHGMDRTWEQVDAPLVPEFKGLICNAIIQSPEGKRRYLARLRELYTNLLHKEALRARLDEVSAKLKPTLAQVGAEKIQARNLLLMKKRIDRRLDFIAKDLPLEEARLKLGDK